jgi:hypothetical protein
LKFPEKGMPEKARVVMVLFKVEAKLGKYFLT